jgi:hypothetical protein
MGARFIPNTGCINTATNALTLSGVEGGLLLKLLLLLTYPRSGRSNLRFAENGSEMNVV